MLPKNFKPAKKYNLLRLGQKNDGGYLIEKNSISQSRLLLSFGICNDWSFDADFYKKQPVKIEAFDPTTTAKFLLKRIASSVLGIGISFWRPHRTIPKAVKNLAVFLDYFFFFRADRKLHHITVGYNGNRSKNFKTIMQDIGDNYPVFVKCDIEGGEYRILDDIIDSASHIAGLAIEFHDVDLRLKTIEKFIESFPLDLVHIHANNFGGIDEQGDPLALELSFAKNPEAIGEECNLPHSEDAPNNPKKKDIALKITS